MRKLLGSIGFTAMAVAALAVWMPGESSAVEAPAVAAEMQYYFIPWPAPTEGCFGGCQGSVCCQIVIVPEG